MAPKVGQVWRSSLGGKPEQVVFVDDRFAYLKRADSTKRDLANPRGGRVASLGEFERGEWRLIEDTSRRREENPA